MDSAKSALRTMLPQRLYGPIRARRMRRLVDAYPPRTAEHVYAGFPLVVHLQDPLAEGWYDRDWPEPEELSRLRDGRLAPGARVFDIGAHQGIVALIVARIVGPGGAVVAVEAEPHNARVARLNAESNAAGNLTVLHAAGAATPGVVSFTEGLNGAVARRRAPGSIDVTAVTVDQLAERYGAPDAVLIDVEGQEANVLAGAAATVASGRTDFFVELHDAAALAAAGSTAEQVLAAFDPARFTVEIGQPDTPDRDARWQPLSPTAAPHGRRCFLVARTRA